MALVTRVLCTSKSEKQFVIQKLIHLRPLFSHHQPCMTFMCSERFYRWLTESQFVTWGIFLWRINFVSGEIKASQNQTQMAPLLQRQKRPHVSIHQKAMKIKLTNNHLFHPPFKKSFRISVPLSLSLSLSLSSHSHSHTHILSYFDSFTDEPIISHFLSHTL